MMKWKHWVVLLAFEGQERQEGQKRQKRKEETKGRRSRLI